MGTLKAALEALADIASFIGELFRAKNAPDVKAGKIAAVDAKETDRIAKEVAAKDVEATRKDLAE